MAELSNHRLGKALIAGFAATLVLAAGVWAAGGGGRGLGGGGGLGGGIRAGLGGEFLNGNEPMRPLPADRDDIPNWEVDARFSRDVFTFVRLRFTTSSRVRGGGTGTGTSWLNDWPDSDLGLSFRLQQVTSMKVNPNPIQLQIDDPALFDYPFAYILQVGRIEFTEREVAALRRWLNNGGFLMVDDFWGSDQQHWHEQLKRIFPQREPVELGLDHPIFHMVFDLKEIPQIPTLQQWLRWNEMGEPQHTWRNADDPKPHFRAIYDDKGRIMVLECANNDIGDAWEREANNEAYFKAFAERLGYPLAVNIVVYAMTH